MMYLFRLLSYIPLRIMHGVGAAAGWVVYFSSSKFRQRWNDNCDQANLSQADRRAAIAHNGRMMFELPRLWLGKPVPYSFSNIEAIEHAYAAGRGIVFLTPHLGCFEITAQAVAEHFSPKYGDLTVMYRPPRQAWLTEIMRHIRERAGLKTVTTTMLGVRTMLRELRQGRAVGLLPDHVPRQGQGVWADFFGKPAYTMTLAAKLVHQTQADMVVVWGERLSAGRGYVIHCLPLTEPLSNDLQTAVEQINRMMEQIILTAPAQYMWSYKRYRQPGEQAIVAQTKNQ